MTEADLTGFKWNEDKTDECGQQKLYDLINELEERMGTQNETSVSVIVTHTSGKILTATSVGTELAFAALIHQVGSTIVDQLLRQLLARQTAMFEAAQMNKKDMM